MKEVGLYVHIPFCHARCGYCDFATVVSPSQQYDSYLNALLKEADQYLDKKVNTLFVGGGTPTVLSPHQIERVLNHLHHTFDTTSLGEATFEANPESATPEVLQAYQKGGMNRISFGLQTTQNTLLKKLDRLHSWEDFLKAYHTARALGFRNINVDLIFGLPNQTKKDWLQTLEQVLALNPDHLSLYALKIEPGTPFEKQGMEVDDDLQAEMYLLASTLLSSCGFEHYEISNFAKPGKESQHNLRYWQNKDTLGLGLSAASYINGVRKANTRIHTHYEQALQQGKSPVKDLFTLTDEQRRKENILLQLRLKSGVPMNQIEALQIPAFHQFLDQRRATLQEGCYRLNPQGWLVSNQLFQHLV